MIPLALPDGEWEVVVDPGWPGFAGHFPGAPIVPAAEVIEWALAVAGAQSDLVRARFIAPVLPGARIRLRRMTSSRGLVAVVATCAQTTVAEILFAGGSGG